MIVGQRVAAAQAAAAGRPAVVPGWYEWGMVLLSAWFAGGLALDGWAHSHGRVDQSFFTPWHAVFYSGFAAVALWLGLGVARGVLAGRSWREALPAGYTQALIGAPLFALGGAGDMLWHEIFGIEQNLEALLSPSHLLLALSMVLILSAPTRAAWLRPPAAARERMPLAALLGLAAALAVISFMTQYGHPYVYLLARVRYDDTSHALGLTAMLVQTALLVGALLLCLRRWSLPPLGAALLLLPSAAMLSVIEDHHWVMLVALAGGLAADGLHALLRPAPGRPLALGAIAALTPAALWGAYFIAIRQTGALGWSVHLWSGALMLTALVGLMLSTLVQSRPHERR